jgi:hypothetical protein
VTQVLVLSIKGPGSVGTCRLLVRHNIHLLALLEQMRLKNQTNKTETYNTRDSPVVTHPSTSLVMVDIVCGFRGVWN